MTYFRNLFFQTADGITLYVRDYPGPNPDAPVVLCLHGLSRNSRDFEDLAPHLQKTHRVLVPDQRGRGRSERDPVSERYQPQNYVGDMLALLDGLAVPRCAVIGTSMGGLMAMGISALAPGRLTRVVINDIGPVIGAEGLARIKAVVGSEMQFASWADATDYVQTANAAAFPRYTRTDWERFAARACSQRGEVVMLDYDPLITAPMKAGNGGTDAGDLWPLFDTLQQTPVLLIRGGISDLLDEDCVAEMRRRHGGLSYLEVPDVGHAPMLDEPGVVDTLLNFLAQ